jgi:hypothetical protein
MATISARTFVDGRIDDQGGGWTYLTYRDRGAKRRRRHWELVIRPEGVVSATLDRSKTDHGKFNLACILPRKVAYAILAAAIRDGLVPVNSDT